MTGEKKETAPTLNQMFDHPAVTSSLGTIMDAIKRCDEQVDADDMCECARFIRSELATAWWQLELERWVNR